MCDDTKHINSKIFWYSFTSVLKLSRNFNQRRSIHPPSIFILHLYFFVPAVIFVYIVVIVFVCICFWICWSEKEQGCLATPQFHSPPLVNSQRSELRSQLTSLTIDKRGAVELGGCQATLLLLWSTNSTTNTNKYNYNDIYKCNSGYKKYKCKIKYKVAEWTFSDQNFFTAFKQKWMKIKIFLSLCVSYHNTKYFTQIIHFFGAFFQTLVILKMFTNLFFSAKYKHHHTTIMWGS